MSDPSPIRLPGESDAYRAARQSLLDAERSLRREVERVAALRRALPPGGPIPTDYVFEEHDRTTDETRTIRLSELFVRPEKSLVLYSFMYPAGAKPCPMCTSFLDALDGTARHVGALMNLAVVARGPIAQTTAWAETRGWTNLRFLSSASNDYNRDYFAETESGSQNPMLTVFRRDGDAIRHFYSTEMFFVPPEAGQHPRHVDMVFPLWNLMDFTPEGRPADWFPSLDQREAD